MTAANYIQLGKARTRAAIAAQRRLEHPLLQPTLKIAAVPFLNSASAAHPHHPQVLADVQGVKPAQIKFTRTYQVLPPPPSPYPPKPPLPRPPPKPPSPRPPPRRVTGQFKRA